MTWTKLGDEWSDDTDIAGLSDAAVRTHIDALVWSNSRLLDLVIPKRDLPRFAFSKDAERAVTELVTVEWWIDLGDRWRIEHRAVWQRTRDQVEATRLKNLRAQWHRRGRHDLCDHHVSSDDNTADSTDDVSDDVMDDPGRDGSGREGLYETEPTTEVGTCALCGKPAQWQDSQGLCWSCFEAAA
jgi:hypothetical protein